MFPKEWRVAGGGKFSQKAPSAGSSVIGIPPFYRALPDHETVDNDLARCGKVQSLGQHPDTGYPVPS